MGGVGTRKARSNMLEFIKDLFEIQNQDIWNTYIYGLHMTNSQCTVDAHLAVFKGCCSFWVNIPSKPRK